MPPVISVIIPTYNRPESLAVLLGCLAQQTLPVEQFEVIAVDDGSQASYAEVMAHAYPFQFTLLRQSNAGEAIARNLGAAHARASFLVFLDDDMSPQPEYLGALLAEHQAHPAALLIGHMLTKPNPAGSLFHRLSAQADQPNAFGEVPFTHIAAGVLALPKEIYKTLDGMKPVPDETRGAWMDLDFAFRAHKAGFTLRRVREAVVFHDDYAVKTLDSACQRMYKVSRLAVRLFQRIPDLQPPIAMFRDKTPLDLKRDPLRLTLRKLARVVASTWASIGLLKGLIWLAERICPSPRLLLPLYRWVIGGYIYQGYRAGLKELREANSASA